MPRIAIYSASKVRRANWSGRGKPALIGFLALGFQYFYEIRQIQNQASVVMNIMVLLFCCLVARGDRKRGNRQMTDTQMTNPRCACM